MKYNGKGEMKWIISVIHHGIVLLRNLIFYMIYTGGSEKGDVCIVVIRLECKKLTDSDKKCV